ncbi:MAG: hypothetical protein IPL27_21600 [Lewinellaceae bacterium]|nr:hypothetical protein [Lewinellaceae bacterium]
MGNFTKNVLPTPTVLSTEISPPMALTNSRVNDSPMPVPPALVCSWFFA